jgi:hypothetical protein
MPTWPRGTGELKPIKTLVVSAEGGASDDRSELVVPTPLDMIATLEDTQQPIATVILVGRYAADLELAASLRELYPFLNVVGR